VTDPKRILVAGATGYIGGRLIPALLDAGHEVRGLARTPGKLAGRVFACDQRFEAVGGDVLERASLDEPLSGIDAAFYLVHSLGAGSDFRQRDIDAASTFARACSAAGVGRIIYLSGLGGAGDDLSEHLESRQATGDALRTAGVPVTELRAAVIIGSGSASFEIMRDLTRRLPAMVAPKWVSSRCEPIAIDDVVRYLVGCLDEPRTAGETFDIGGGTVLTYREMLRVAAEEQHRPFRMLSVPVLTPKLSSYWLHLVTSVDMQVARPLVDGLRNDVVTHDHRIRDLLPGALEPYRDAVRKALNVAAAQRESRWQDARFDRIEQPLRRFRIRRDLNVFQDRQVFETPLAADELWRRVEANFGGRGGYGMKAEILWRIRGAADRVLGGSGLRRGRPPGVLAEGDAVDWWRVERIDPGHALSLVAEMRVPGVAHLELEVEATDHGSRLVQTATLGNTRFASGLYWFCVAPFHDWVFRELGAHLIAEGRAGPAPAAGDA
jgi:uncharacterized protein YbjT (DUF2867 family)